MSEKIFRVLSAPCGAEETHKEKLAYFKILLLELTRNSGANPEQLRA